MLFQCYRLHQHLEMIGFHFPLFVNTLSNGGEAQVLVLFKMKFINKCSLLPLKVFGCSGNLGGSLGVEGVTNCSKPAQFDRSIFLEAATL